jgi:hypothetical protein
MWSQEGAFLLKPDLSKKKNPYEKGKLDGNKETSY